MPIDSGIYSQLQPVRLNTPFQNLSEILQVRQQQESARGLREQREAIAEQRRAQTEAIRMEAAAAKRVRALFERVDQATGQPIAPQQEEVASIVGPAAATDIFKGFEALKKSTWENQQTAVQDIASILGGIEKWPAPDRQRIYGEVRRTLIQQNKIKPEDAPDTYDASWVAQKRREALTAMQQFEQDKPKPDYTLGDQRMSGADNSVLATAQPDAPKPDVLGSEPDFIRRWATERGFNADKLSASQMAGAKQAKARAEQAPSQAQGPQPGWQWILRDGKTVHTNQTKPGDEPLRAQLNTGDTAQDRQRNARTTAAKDFLARLNELRTKINTKMGPSAGATGYARRFGAALGMDPDVAEYERIRAAGGRALAVAIMGAQNLSDQDANAWSNMLPDARTDEQTAGRLTTQVENMLNGMTGSGPAATNPVSGGRPAPANETPEARLRRLLGGG